MSDARTAVLCLAAVAGLAVRLQAAVKLTPEEFRAYTTRGSVPSAAATGGFSVQTTDRVDVVVFYHCTYMASEGWETRMGWTGDIANCVAGTVSNAFHEDTLRRINWFRAMAGLPSGITFDGAKNTDCQQAALMMSRNWALYHNPPTNWYCFSSAGSNAASKANLHFGFTGPAGVNSLMRDDGANNLPVGHRRWILYSAQTSMGDGGVPASGGYSATYVQWVIGDFGPHATIPFIAWPPAGYVPYDVVYPRWSFGLTNGNSATFSNATVTMTRNGSPMAAVKIHPTPTSLAGGYGNYSMVWEPQGLPAGAPAADDVYVVMISNIVGAAQSSFTYTVRVIDPYALGCSAAIGGPTNPVVGAVNNYTFTPVPRTASYDLRIRKAAAAHWIEGAETNPAPRIVDGTSANYPLIQSAVKRSGSHAFHLAFPGFTQQWFEIDRAILPATNTTLNFAFLRRYSSTSNVIRAEITRDDGLTWTTLWTTNGICSNTCNSSYWDPAFAYTDARLSAFTGVPVRIRFSFQPSGVVYTGTDQNYGVFIDDISVSNALDIVSESTSVLSSNAGSFTFSPDAAAPYLLDIRPTVGCTTFGYGPIYAVNAATGGATMIRAQSVGLAAAQLVIGFGVEGSPLSSYTLERLAGDLRGTNWAADAGAVFSASPLRFTTPLPGTNAAMYRIRGSP